MPSAADDRPWCVIGAGPSGLAALRHLLAAGIPVECLEREPSIGSNSRFGSGTSRVFASTRLTSSKRLTEFADFPMPRHFPAYPDHRQCLEYFEAYAEHFGLDRHITTGRSVERIESLGPPGAGWLVQAGGEPRRYAGVVIASGHNHVPRWPEIPGEFSGDLLHSAHYKSPTEPVPLAGRREVFDVVICATGYQTTLPFIDGRLLGADAADGVPRLFMNLLHSCRDDIAVVGLIQPDSGQWGITDVQARLVAGMASAARKSPAAAAWLYARRQRPAGSPPEPRRLAPETRRLAPRAARVTAGRPILWLTLS